MTAPSEPDPGAPDPSPGAGIRTGKPQRVRRGAKPRTSRQEILRAALYLLDTEGLRAVSLRRVATELGITPMPLYGYFDSKDHLLNAMVAEAFPSFSGEVDELAPWQDQLSEVMHQLHSALTRHPGALELLLSRADPDLDPIRETLIRILCRAGFDASHAITLLTMLVSYVIGWVVISYHRGDPAEEIARMRRLPESQFPNLRDTAVEYAARGSQQNYELSLALFIAALESAELLATSQKDS